MSKENYSKILDYLIEFYTKKEQSTINIETDENNYKEIIWLSEIPASILCSSSSQSDAHLNSWIKISKPRELKEPSFPNLSEVMELWADKESLKNENGTPHIKASIFVNGKTLLSTSYPQIENEFKDYIRDKWLDDLIIYKELVKTFERKKPEHEALIKFYDKLTKLHQLTEKLEDDHELVIGTGLIYYKKGEESPLICRHLLTHKAEISYDALQKDTLIEIKADIEHPIQVETDIFPLIMPKFDNATIVNAERQVYYFIKEENIIDILTDNKTKEAINLFIENLDDSLEFIDESNKSKVAIDKPIICFAPAIILRKIFKGGITSLSDRIIKQFENSEEEQIITEKLQELENNEEEALAEEARNPGFITSSNAATADDNRLRFNNRPDLLSMSEYLIFTSNFNVYKVQNKGMRSKIQIIENIAFESGEKPIYITGTRNYSGYLIVAFENGKIGKINLDSYKTEFNRKMLKNAYNNESPLIYIEHIEEEIDLVAISNINKVILFNTRQIGTVGSKITKGFQVMKSKDRSFMARIKKLEQVKLQDPEYYRRDEGLNAVGFYLKQGDEI